jgi:hypothetical protein
MKIRTTRKYYNIPDGLAETYFVKEHVFYMYVASGGFHRNEIEQNLI